MEESVKEITYKLERIRAEAEKAGISLAIPPPTFKELGIELIDYQKGKSLKAKFPFQARFTNPMGIVQGGFISAAIDDVYGPLAYLCFEGPCVSLSMQTQYMRPFSSREGDLVVEAKVVKLTRQVLFLEATAVSTANNKLVATSNCQCFRVNPETNALKT